MRFLKYFFLVFTWLIPLSEPLARMESGIIYGKNHAFTLDAPQGWVLDNTNGVRQGLSAVFYPENSSWENSQAIMYVKVIQKSDSYSNLEKMIEDDIDEVKKRAPRVKISKRKELTTSDDTKKVEARDFLGDNFGNYETVAYIDEPRVVVFLVLSAKNKKDFQQSAQAFQELVHSYNFLTDQVKTESDQPR